MKRFRMTAAMLGLIGAYFAPCVRADDRNKETHLTINVPLRVHDTLLAPGEYVFKVIDLGTSSAVVEIFNSDGTRVEATIIGLPAYRNNVGDNKVFTISDPQGDQPATLQSWFYPGDNFGVEFRAAKRANEASHVSRTNGKRQNGAKTDTAAPAGN
jgi:hypothetical protein